MVEKVYDDARRHRVGWLKRPARFWDDHRYDEEPLRGGASALRFAVHHEPSGTATGYAIYRLATEPGEFGGHTVLVVELATTTRQAHTAIWRYLIGIDVHTRITWASASDEPLPHLLLDPRSVRAVVRDNLRGRLVDLDRALTARRYAIPLDVVLEVSDDFCPWNVGRFRLVAEDDSVSRTPHHRDAHLRPSSTELGAAFLGDTTLTALEAAGRVHELRRGRWPSARSRSGTSAIARILLATCDNIRANSCHADHQRSSPCSPPPPSEPSGWFSRSRSHT